MNLNEFNQIFEIECKKNNMKILEGKKEKFFYFIFLMLEWNEK